MKRAITLSGRANLGKSSTLLRTYQLLRQRHPQCECEYEILDGDVRAVLSIEGVKVGIESQGDPGGRLIKSLELFIRLKCSVVVCATRTRGQTVEAVDRLKKLSYVIVEHRQLEAHEDARSKRNSKMAKTIADEVDAAL